MQTRSQVCLDGTNVTREAGAVSRALAQGFDDGVHGVAHACRRVAPIPPVPM